MHSQHFKAKEQNTYGDGRGIVEPGDMFTFHYNSDLSGEVLISSRRPCAPDGFVEMQEEIVIPAWMLLEFVGGFVNDELVSALQDLDGQETLNLIRNKTSVPIDLNITSRKVQLVVNALKDSRVKAKQWYIEQIAKELNINTTGLGDIEKGVHP